MERYDDLLYKDIGPIGKLIAILLVLFAGFIAAKIKLADTTYHWTFKIRQIEIDRIATASMQLSEVPELQGKNQNLRQNSKSTTNPGPKTDTQRDEDQLKEVPGPILTIEDMRFRDDKLGVGMSIYLNRTINEQYLKVTAGKIFLLKRPNLYGIKLPNLMEKKSVYFVLNCEDVPMLKFTGIYDESIQMLIRNDGKNFPNAPKYWATAKFVAEACQEIESILTHDSTSKIN